MSESNTLNIPDDERDIIIEKLVPATKSNIEHGLKAVVGQVISNKVVNNKAFRSIMFKTWEEYKGLYITDMGDNRFLFTFPTVLDAEEVLNRAPWFVMNQVLSLQRWEEGIAFEKINFDLVLFWVQIHGLPREDVNPANAEILLRKMGRVVEVDDPFKLGGGTPTHFLGARVLINIRKPIWSGCWIQKSDEIRVWANFKYERLQDLCFKCGEFGHEIKQCRKPMVMAADNKDRPKYGQFLTTYKPKVFYGSNYGGTGNQRQRNYHANSNTYEEGQASNEANDSFNQERDVNMNNYSDVNTNEESIPLAKMIFHKYDCRDYELPAFQGNPPTMWNYLRVNMKIKMRILTVFLQE